MSERLESLQINKEVSTSDEQTDTEMSVAPVTMNQENGQVGLPKNMVPDPGWFDGDQMKFED